MVQLVAGEARQTDVVLERIPQMLDTIKVKERPLVVGIGLAAFEERRRLGFGKFFDSTELRKNEHRKLSDLLHEIPGTLVVAPGPPFPSTARFAGSSRVSHIKPCLMEVVLDGEVISKGQRAGEPPNYWNAYDLTMLSVATLAGVEVYRSAAEIPGVYSGPSAECGVLLIWTRRD
jgi:hypothetical protein